MNVTGRYWGFLALPLSLLATAALWRYATTERPTHRSAMLIACAFAIQMAFQGESLLAAWWPSRVHQEVSLAGMFDGQIEHITALRNPSTDANPHQQGEYISPVRAVVNCYDMDNFTRAEVHTGSQLIKALRIDGTAQPAEAALEGGFMTWSRMRIASSATARSIDIAAQHNSMLHIELNQAYHTGWSSPQCKLTRGAHDTLVANCPARNLQAGPIDLVFFDPVSEIGKQVSIRAAVVVGIAMGLLAPLGLIPKRRTAPAPSVG